MSVPAEAGEGSLKLPTFVLEKLLGKRRSDSHAQMYELKSISGPRSFSDVEGKASSRLIH